MDPISILQAVVRWIHVFSAILWIGQTYLFNFMEKSLERSEDANIFGNLWMVHGGGFYFVQKQKQPKLMPMKLHWFKWEAASTFLSGLVLIILTYYIDGLLVEPGQNFWVAAVVGIGSSILGFGIYDGLVRSPLGKKPIAFAIIGLVLLLALHQGYLQVMSDRAAFIHIGAVIGTIMTANVWERILPAQSKMLAAIERNEPFDPKIAATGPARSRHNSYMVVGLVLIMISNHYPSITYGNDYSTAILGLVIVAGWYVAYLFRRNPEQTPTESVS